MLLFLLAFSSCKEYAPISIKEHGVDKTFNGLLNEAIDNSHGNMYGVSIAIHSPEHDLDWSKAVGYDGKEKTDTLDLNQPFRIASVTKTFVATAILRLHEMDSISIHDPITKYISPQHQDILSQDEYDLDKITILTCLNHTSGLYDYAMGGSPYIGIVKETPKRRWTRTEQLEFAVKHGQKLGYPGEKYNYSDTGYILLGEIIGRFYNNDLALGLRTLIDYDKLMLNHTWLETLEEAPTNISDQVHRYLGSMDATKFDPSTDLYGGGGIVSTTADLSKFMRALFNNKIFSKNSTLDLMLEKPNHDPSYDHFKDRRYKDYRQGLWEVKLMGNKVYMHSGLWGTHVLHQPNNNTTLAVNFTRGGNDRLIKKVMMAVNGLKKEK